MRKLYESLTFSQKYDIHLFNRVEHVQPSNECLGPQGVVSPDSMLIVPRVSTD